MNILIRCDSSNIIGTGHIMRCINLCEYYPENSYTFVCRNFQMNISEKILKNKHNLILLDYDIEPEINNYRTWIGCEYLKEINELISLVENNKYDEIIIDHYGIDHVLEEKIKKYCKKLTVITDIFEYSHYCDIFINYNSDDKEKLKKLNLNSATEIKCGVKNIILNKKFINVKKQKYNDKVKNICIMLGGSDPQNYTLKIIKQINELVKINYFNVKIIIGKANNYMEDIKEYISNIPNYSILFDLNYDELIELYLETDLCIGSLSITAYERYFMNVPQICLKIVDNQNIQQLEEFNICTINDLITKFYKFINNNID